MNHHDFMRLAYEEAKLAYQENEVPIGCVIVDDKQTIIAKAHNQKEAFILTTSHAEILAIETASKKLNNWRLLNCSAYITIEPCMMCVGALMHARVKNIYYGWHEPKFGALHSCLQFQDLDYGNHRFYHTENLKHEASSRIMSEFFKRKRSK